MTDLPKAISPLRELSINYQDSKKPNPSEFSMNEKLFFGKIALFGKEDLFFEKISNKFNIILPTIANTTSTNDKITALWLSQKEWLIALHSSTNNEDIEFDEEDEDHINEFLDDEQDQQFNI